MRADHYLSGGECPNIGIEHHTKARKGSCTCREFFRRSFQHIFMSGWNLGVAVAAQIAMLTDSPFTEWTIYYSVNYSVEPSLQLVITLSDP